MACPSPAPIPVPVPADCPIPKRPTPDPAPRYRGVLQPPRRARSPLHRRWVPPREAGAAGCRGPGAQLLLMHPQQRPGAESHAAAGAGEAPHAWHAAPWKAQRGGGHLGVPPCQGRGLGRVHRPARRWLRCLKPPLLRWHGRGRVAAPLTLAIATVYHGHWKGGKNVAWPPEQSTEYKMGGAPPAAVLSERLSRPPQRSPFRGHKALPAGLARPRGCPGGCPFSTLQQLRTGHRCL